MTVVLCINFICLSILTIPPQLFWTGTSCWNESIFLFLRNIRPLTENLIQKKDNFFSNELANEYQALLKLTPDAQQRKITENTRYHKLACRKLKITETTWAHAHSIIESLLNELSQASSQYLSILFWNNMRPLLGLDIFGYNSIEDALNASKNHILALSNFIILVPSPNFKNTINIPIKLDMSPYLKESIPFEKFKYQKTKTIPGTFYYELIGIVAFVNNNHLVHDKKVC